MHILVCDVDSAYRSWRLARIRSGRRIQALRHQRATLGNRRTNGSASGRLIMKLAGGFFLWGVIVVIFGRWARDQQRLDEERRELRETLRVS